VTRHRVRNNLPGTSEFCPLVRRTAWLHKLLGTDLAADARAVIGRAAPELVARARRVSAIGGFHGILCHRGRTTAAEAESTLGSGDRRGRATAPDPGRVSRLQRLVIGDARFTHLVGAPKAASPRVATVSPTPRYSTRREER